MPTYNWERIAGDGYKYLRQKLKYAENFYDILRIDHVVGLFRIWSIPYQEPLENQGLVGFFDPADESKWAGHGKNLLSILLKSTKMLLCAEDLGVIPKVCTDTLKGLGVPGNDVQRWVKDWKIKHDFLEPKDYRVLSVAMLSTHDTTNWPAWWENEAGTVDEGLFVRKCSDHRQINFGRLKDKLFNPKRSGHGRLRWHEDIDSVEKLVSILGRKKEELADFIDLYQNTYQEKGKLWKHLGFSGRMREKSGAEIVRAALKISSESGAVFCINTIFDLLYLTDLLKGDPYQYRINTPGTISAKNWSLTIPVSLEKLLKHRVNQEIRNMISASGRV
jgi:4-alpha-glucanotransferase